MPQGRIGITDCVYNGKKNHAKFRVKKKKRKNEGRMMSAQTKIHFLSRQTD